MCYNGTVTYTAHTKIMRIVVHTNENQKSIITHKAKSLGISVSELLKRGAEDYESLPDVKDLLKMLDAVEESINRTCNLLDDSINFVEASNKRIAQLEKDRTC